MLSGDVNRPYETAWSPNKITVAVPGPGKRSLLPLNQVELRSQETGKGVQHLSIGEFRSITFNDHRASPLALPTHGPRREGHPRSYAMVLSFPSRFLLSRLLVMIKGPGV